MRKLLWVTLSIILVISLSTLMGITNFGSAQTGTYVGGLISEDTTWTKANSPYIFNSSLEVGRGVTLTIEAGTTIRNGLGLYVNGTLAARGTSIDPIVFDHGQIGFLPWSVGWDEQSQTGSIVEYVIIPNIYVQSASPKIDHVTVPLFTSNGGQPIISNSNIGLASISGSAMVLNNQFTDGFSASGSPTISGNNMTPPANTNAFYVDGSAIVTGNTIIGGGTYQQYPNQAIQRIPAIDISAGSPYIANNIITGTGGVSIYCYAFHNYNTGTSSIVGTLQIFNNTLNGDVSVLNGAPTIEGNVISGEVQIFQGDPGVPIGSTVITNNTILCQSIGLSVGKVNSCLVSENNIESVTDSKSPSVYLGSDATVEQNFITGGLSISGSSTVTVRNNTVVSSIAGSQSSQSNNSIITGDIGPSSSIVFNNLEGGIGLSSSYPVNATYNWWGTTNIQEINQSIHDYKDNLTLGVVSFIPILSEPNTQTFLFEKMPLPTASPTPTPSPTPTSSPTPSPTASPTQTSTLSPSPTITPSPSVPEFPTWIVIMAITAAIAVAIFLKGKTDKAFRQKRRSGV